jgi:hypothetical protein
VVDWPIFSAPFPFRLYLVLLLLCPTFSRSEGGGGGGWDIYEQAVVKPKAGTLKGIFPNIYSASLASVPFF